MFFVVASYIAMSSSHSTPTVEKITFYSHGVATLHLTASVPDQSRPIRLPVPRSHLNDFLKSLTVSDIETGLPVQNTLSYDAPPDSAPTSALDAASRMPISVGDTEALNNLLRVAQGTTMKAVLGDRSEMGLLIGLDRGEHASMDGSVSDARSKRLVLLRPDHSVVFVELTADVELTICDTVVQDRLEASLGKIRASLRSTSGHALVDLRPSASMAQASLQIVYAFEVPVYKLSYRFHLQQGGDVVVSASVILDDPCVACRLDDVEVKIVSGLPMSFRHDLLEPRRLTRPTEPVPRDVGYGRPSDAVFLATSLKPRNHSSDRLRDDVAFDTEDDEEMEEDMDFDLFDGADESSRRNVSKRSRDRDRNAFNEGNSATEQIGELTEFTVPHRVSIPEGQAVMLPLFTHVISGGRISIYSYKVRKSNALSALRVCNNSNASWESGPAAVYDGTHLVGETMLKRCLRNNEQFLPYSVNLQCKADRKTSTISHQQVVAVETRRKNFFAYRSLDFTTFYEFRNNSDEEVDLFVLHPTRKNTDLKSCNVQTTDMVEQTENIWTRDAVGTAVEAFDQQDSLVTYRTAIPEKKVCFLKVVEREQIEDTYVIDQYCSESGINLLLDNGVLDRATADSMREVMEMRRVTRKLLENVKETENRKSVLVRAQDRYRKNLTSLSSLHEHHKSGDDTLLRKYMDLLTESETNISQLESHIKETTQKHTALKEECDEKMGKISFSFRL